MMYDLVGLLSYIIENKHTVESVLGLLNNQQLSFEGIDGKFSFENNFEPEQFSSSEIEAIMSFGVSFGSRVALGINIKALFTTIYKDYKGKL